VTCQDTGENVPNYFKIALLEKWLI
jgi:hypothetical protein